MTILDLSSIEKPHSIQDSRARRLKPDLRDANVPRADNIKIRDKTTAVTRACDFKSFRVVTFNHSTSKYELRLRG